MKRFARASAMLNRLIPAAGVIGLLAVSAPLSAQVSKVATSVGYHINGPATEGTLVSADNSAANTAKATTTKTLNDLLGVVVGPEESLITLNSGNDQRQIAITGAAYALVSDLNGSVNKGDYITVSALAGVGEKSTSSSRVLGMAQTDLARSADLQTISAKNAAGQSVQTKVGLVLVQINIGYYSGQPNIKHDFIPQALQNISDTLAGRKVSPARIILSSLLLLASLAISITLVYSAVLSSMISIGRNPLSKLPVNKNLMRILGLVGLILLVTLIAVYLILK